MKTINYIFLFVSFSFFAQAQTIRRVNATPGITGVNIYTTPQAAHDASVAGDIIYIEPVYEGQTTYGNLTVNRRITLIGTGYNPTLVTGSSFDKRTVNINYIYLNQGSAGSRITGLIIQGLFLKDANCIIDRNKIDYIYLQSEIIEGVRTIANNTLIRNNNINSIIGLNNSSGISTINSIISNNIFSGSVVNSLVSATITRNTFYCTSTVVFSNIDGSTINANIFDARDPVSFFVADAGSEGTTISNNLCTRHAGLPANNGNVNSVSSSTVFKVANPWTVSPFLESNLELSPTSPALTVGPGSTPIGAFSGTTPFVPSGLTNIPFITDFSINGIGNVNSPLQINVKARSNN